MKAGLVWAWLLILAVSEGLAQGQQTGTNAVTSVNSTVTVRRAPAGKQSETTPMTLRLSEPKDTNAMRFQISKTTQVRVGGPLVQPFKANSASGFVGRVAHWFNPLANVEPNVPPAASGTMNTRAWSTIVGWNPGRSAFPDGAWHEPPRLDLIAVTTDKQP